eukprot:m.792720 g.792720  ORF g.792720 m.792720 type:complete len:65 (-) comp23332_c1_seq31:2531-2725(-)
MIDINMFAAYIPLLSASITKLAQQACHWKSVLPQPDHLLGPMFKWRGAERMRSRVFCTVDALAS